MTRAWPGGHSDGCAASVAGVSRIRTERLVNLVICLLSTRRFLTAAQIAATVPGYEHDPNDPKDHEAFQRKFERDKAELRDLGVPLETGTSSAFDAEPGYRITRRDYALPDIPLEPDEAAAVGIAARLWRHAGLAEAASSGLAKLRAAGIDVDPQATLGVEPVVTVDAAFAPLTAATRNRQAVTFDYRVPEDDAPRAAVCSHGAWCAGVAGGTSSDTTSTARRSGASGCPAWSVRCGRTARPGVRAAGEPRPDQLRRTLVRAGRAHAAGHAAGGTRAGCRRPPLGRVGHAGGRHRCSRAGRDVAGCDITPW